MATPLITLAQVKAYIGITKTTEDAFLQSIVSSVSRQLTRQLAKSFQPNPAFAQAATTTLSADAGVGSMRVQLESATGVVGGAILQIPIADGSVDQVLVDTVDGTTISLDEPLQVPHLAGDQVVVLTDTADPVAIAIPINYSPSMLAPPAFRSPASWGGAGAGPPYPLSLASSVPVKIPHAREITSVAWDATTLDPASQYVTWPDPTLGPPFIRTIEVIDGSLLVAQTLTVTGRFGIWPAPEDIVDVAKIMCARRYREKDASWGDVVQSGDGGSVTFFRLLPQSARAILDSYTELGV